MGFTSEVGLHWDSQVRLDCIVIQQDHKGHRLDLDAHYSEVRLNCDSQVRLD